jgi:hypothetical protein
MKAHSFVLIGMVVLTIAPVRETYPQAVEDDLICNGCVNAPDIATHAVTSRALRSSSVTTSKISNGAVTLDKLESMLQARIDALEAAVLRLQEATFEVVDANGDALGVPPPGTSWVLGGVLTPTGYAFQLAYAETSSPYLPMEPLYFESIDCSGTPRLQPPKPVSALTYWGYIFSGFNGVTYYIPQGSTDFGTPTLNSIQQSSGCGQVHTDNESIAVRPNDPAVTGVSGPPFFGPITIRRFSGEIIPSLEPLLSQQ